MTTKKEEESVLNNAGINDSVTVTDTNYNQVNYGYEERTTEKKEEEPVWTNNAEIGAYSWYDDSKRKLASDILIKLIDFNLSQLSRSSRDSDKVLIFDDPANYAAELVNEMFEQIKE